jgi:hypothetical protein
MRRRLSTLIVLVAVFSVMMPVTAQANGPNQYELVQDELNWKDARKAARGMAAEGCESAHLATLTTVAERTLATDLMDGITESNAWLGGRQTGKTLSDNWRWITNEPWVADDANWAGGEPNDRPDENFPVMPGSEQYLELLNDFTVGQAGLWNDAPGHETKFFVVESEGCA